MVRPRMKHHLNETKAGFGMFGRPKKPGIEKPGVFFESLGCFGMNDFGV